MARRLGRAGLRGAPGADVFQLAQQGIKPFQSLRREFRRDRGVCRLGVRGDGAEQPTTLRRELDDRAPLIPCVALALAEPSRPSASTRARRTRHCCSVTPCACSRGRNRLMTASRARNNAIGRERSKGRIGASGASAVFGGTAAVARFEFIKCFWHKRRRSTIRRAGLLLRSVLRARRFERARPPRPAPRKQAERRSPASGGYG